MRRARWCSPCNQVRDNVSLTKPGPLTSTHSENPQLENLPGQTINALGFDDLPLTAKGFMTGCMKR